MSPDDTINGAPMSIAWLGETKIGAEYAMSGGSLVLIISLPGLRTGYYKWIQ